MENKKPSVKRFVFISLIITLFVIVLVNIISSYYFTRFDLTLEKRYTLSDKSKEVLKDIDDNLFLRIYLDGDYSAPYKKFHKEIKEMLDEFRVYSKFIDYEFTNPSKSDDVAERNDVYDNLSKKGLKATYDIRQTNSGLEQNLIWPGIIMSYDDKEIAINLLPDESIQDPEEMLNKAERELEYKLISAIVEITKNRKQTIAFVNGHGELDDPMVYNIVQTLQKKYIVSRATLNEQLNSIMKRYFDTLGNVTAIRPAYDAIVIAKPTIPFSEKDKFIIDQYIMYGGKVLWLVDPVYVSMDSLGMKGITMATPLNLNLDDQLFRYGVNMKKNLLRDLSCVNIGVTQELRGAIQVMTLPWCYSPLLRPASDNSIVKDINFVMADFVGSLEPTTSASGIQKTPLLKTSDYTGMSDAPVSVRLAITREHQFLLEKNVEPKIRAMFPDQGQVTAYLLTGVFHSLYENRLTTEFTESAEIGFKSQSVPNAMIVVADGDIICNQLADLNYAKTHNVKPYTPLPLGYDLYTDRTYGNKQFIENAITYLLEGDELIQLRSRDFKIRLLDKKAVSKNQLTLQIINVVVPSLIMIGVGVALLMYRNYKYKKTKSNKVVKKLKQ